MRQGSGQKLTTLQIERSFRLELERHYKRDITAAEGDGIRDMVATYSVFDKLCQQGRDSVWAYVARNLARR